MKKALLASTAIVAAAAIASPAYAADPVSLSMGGGMEQYIGFADVEDDTGVREFATFDEQSDTEIQFSGSTVLDNGIRIGVRMELQSDVSDGGIDESWMDIQTSWGSVRLGADDVMAEQFEVSPNSGILDDYNNWVPAAGVNGNVTNDDPYNLANSGDDNMIHYISPSLWGFQVGATYVPEVGSGSGNGTPNRATDTSEGLSAGVYFEQSFGDVGVEAQYGYYTEGGESGAAATDSRHDNHNFGLNLTYGGFGIGGNYGRYIGSDEETGDDGFMWQAGVWYGSGPFDVGFLYKFQQNEGTNVPGDDDSELVGVHFDYVISDGVTWESMIFAVDYGSETGVDANFTDGGWGVVGGLDVAF